MPARLRRAGILVDGDPDIELLKMPQRRHEEAAPLATSAIRFVAARVAGKRGLVDAGRLGRPCPSATGFRGPLYPPRERSVLMSDFEFELVATGVLDDAAGLHPHHRSTAQDPLDRGDGRHDGRGQIRGLAGE